MMKKKIFLSALAGVVCSINVMATEVGSGAVANEVSLSGWFNAIVLRYVPRPRPIRH